MLLWMQRDDRLPGCGSHPRIECRIPLAVLLTESNHDEIGPLARFDRAEAVLDKRWAVDVTRDYGSGSGSDKRRAVDVTGSTLSTT